MLRSEDLSRDSFEDILKTATAEAVKLCPDWTDHNAADPGITILELMSWLAEVQRYHLNSVNERHFSRYLKLLGCAPSPSVPARTYLKLSGGGFAARGSVFYADDIPFETEYGCSAADNEILSLGAGERLVANKDDILADSLRSFANTFVFPFGEGKPYTKFRVRLKNPLPTKSVVGIYFGIRLEKPCAEITNREDCIVSVGVRAGDFPVKILLDETMGFTRSGVIMLRTGDTAAAELVFSVESGEFAAMPIVTAAVINVVPALQQRTLSRILRFDNVEHGVIRTFVKPAFLFALNGEERTLLEDFTADGERITVNSTARSFEAVVCGEGFGERCCLGRARGVCNFRIKPDVVDMLESSARVYVCEDGVFRRWELVEDFDSADKYSRCFVYDPDTGEIVFGNGEKGMPPRGDIYLFGCVTSLKNGGNVRAGAVSSTNEKGISAVNILPSEGGAERQSVDECYAEVRAAVNSPRCCVTLEDYENAVRSTPGMPRKHIRAFVSEFKDNCVCIAVEHFIGNSAPNGGLMRNLKRRILPVAQLGTKVEFPAVRYAPVNVYIRLGTDAYSADSRELAERTVRGFFDSDRVNFGGTISVNDFSRYVCESPWVRAVLSVDLSVSASDGERLPSGDVRLKNVCLPTAGKISVVVEH